MKCIFIFNPKSGRGKILKKIDYIKNELLKKFQEVDIYQTQSQEDTINIAKKASYLYDTIVFAGGDGTFNDIASGVACESHRPTLGYIPSGTVNDIARNLKISKNIKKAVKIIQEGNTIKHDVGLINGNKYFIYVTAAGTFTAISYRTKQRAKKALGKMAYIFDGISELFNPSILNVKVTSIDGVVIEGKCPLLLIANSISVGGIYFNPEGHANDGTFDVIFVKKYIGRGFFSIFNTLLFGIKLKRKTRYYEKIKCSECYIEADENVQWCIDGEKGMKGTIKIKNIPEHLEIIVPKNKK